MEAGGCAAIGGTQHSLFSFHFSASLWHDTRKTLILINLRTVQTTKSTTSRRASVSALMLCSYYLVYVPDSGNYACVRRQAASLQGGDARERQWSISN